MNNQIDYYKIDYVLNTIPKSKNYDKSYGDYVFNNTTKTFIELIINTYYDFINKGMIDTGLICETNTDNIQKILDLFQDKNNRLYKDLDSCIDDYTNFGIFADDIFKLSSCKNIEVEIQRV